MSDLDQLAQAARKPQGHRPVPAYAEHQDEYADSEVKLVDVDPGAAMKFGFWAAIGASLVGVVAGLIVMVLYALLAGAMGLASRL